VNIPLSQRIHWLPAPVLFFLVALSAAPEARLQDVQAVEAVQLSRALIVAALVCFAGFRLPWSGLWRQIGAGYVIFLASCLILAAVALRLPFFPPETSLLKQPFAISLSRVLELFLGAYFMIALAETVCEDPKLLRRAMDVYTAVAFLSAVCSSVAFAIFLATGNTAYFVSELDNRARGFFNEGGPYGIFLISALLVLMMRRKLFGPGNRFGHAVAMVILLLALVLSASKAGFMAGILCGLSSAVVLNWRRVLALALLITLSCVAFWMAFQNRFLAYARDITEFDSVVQTRPDDINLIMGRVTAALIIPRMIEAHPVLGIGIGNYSLMRNDPDYLQGLPAAAEWDLPGLGLISVAAELGIPLVLFFAWLLARPVRMAWRARCPAIVVAVAAFQPAAYVLGVNLNFFYPWLLSGFALAAVLLLSPPSPELAEPSRQPYPSKNGGLSVGLPRAYSS
jgi:O-Antigen ligase